MKKEYKWKVNVDGQTHIVRCETFKTVFDVYVDDELTARVPRRNEEGTDMEEEIHVGGKKCQFVVYDGMPDLAVDGILRGAEDSMRRTELRNRILLFIGGIFTASVSTFAAFLWFVFEAAGEPIFGGYAALFCIALFALGGLAMVFFALKPKKTY